MRPHPWPLILALVLVAAPSRAPAAVGQVQVQKTGVAIQRNVGFECADLVEARDFSKPVTQTEAQDAARAFYGTQTRPADPNAPDPARIFIPDPSNSIHGATPLKPGEESRPPGDDDTRLPPEPGLTPPPLTVRFESIESGLTDASAQLLILRVSKDSKHKSEWSVMASLRANEAFARRALLFGLNYRLLPAQLWPKLTIHFEPAQDAQRKAFLQRLADVSDREIKDWVVDGTQDGPDVTIRNLVLTTAGTSLEQVEWAIGKNYPDIDTQPERFTDSNCAFRQLLLPWVMLDIGDKQKINAFGWRMGEIQGDSLIFIHRFAKLFRNTTYTEVRRIGMEIAAKPPQFWSDVMAAAKLPQAVTDLLVEKIKSRRNDLVRLLELRPGDMGGQDTSFKVNQKITIASSDPKNPYVKNGKLLQESFPGWPHSFRAPDNKSPLTPPEIFRYIGIEAVAAAFEEAGQQLTDRWLSRNVQAAAQSHGEDLRKQLIDAIMNNKPFIQRFGQPWAKGIYSVNFNASRRVVSGNYFGGDIKAAQQIDSFSFQAGAGLFMGIDNIPHLPIGTVAQGQISRNWLHQKPLDDPNLEIMKKAIQNDKTPILGPFYFTKLGLALRAQDNDTSAPTPNPNDPSGQQVWKDPLQKFLDTLEVGESLTVADTLAGSATTLIPINDLIDFKILGSTFGLTPKIGYQQAIIKKTKIQRTQDKKTQALGIQIDVSSLPPHLFEVGLEVGYFAQLLSYSHGIGGGNGTTWTFQIPDPQTKEDRDYVSSRLRKILFNNDTSLLIGTKDEIEQRKVKFTPHHLEARVSSKQNSINLLFHQRFQVDTTSTLAYQPPAPTADEMATPGAENFNPADKELDFWVDTKKVQSGNNFTSYLLSLIPKLPLGKEAQNPQNNFLGVNNGTTVTTELEFTEYRETLPQTSFESHVRGRTIGKDKLLNVIDTMISKLGPLGTKFNLRQEAKDEFAGIDTVQLYDVSELLTLPNEAFNKLRDALQIHELKDPNQGDTEEDLVLLNLLEIEGSLEGQEEASPPGAFVRVAGSIRDGVKAAFGAGKGLLSRVVGHQPAPKPEKPELETAPVTPARPAHVLTGDAAVQNGLNRLGAWCEKNGEYWPKDTPWVERSGTDWGPYTIQKFQELHRHGKVVMSGDYLWLFRCVKPWMWELLDARRKYIHRLKDKPEDLFKSYTELASLVGIITKGGSFPSFLGWLGEGNYGYQVRVSGFRVGSEQQGDADIGLEDYASSTIGTATPELQGTIQSLIQEKKLSPDTVTNLLGGLSGEKAQ